MDDVKEIYEEIDFLGKGHYGRVYKVRNVTVGRVEALKIVNTKKATQSQSDLLSEAKKQYDVQCDNVVELYNAFPRNGKLYISMEYIEGGTLESMAEEEYITVRQLVHYLSDCLHGLSRIHNKGYIHRDIKPNNILLSDSGAKLSDFGLSDKVGSDKRLRTGYGYGTHKAPEVFRGTGYIKQSDIYAVGVTAYRILNTDDFLDDFDDNEFVNAVVKGKCPPRNDKEYRWDIPKKLIKAINKSMDVDLNKRYKSVHKFRAAINNVDIPIDWIQTINKSKRKVWDGQCDHYSYKVEVTKQLIGNKFDINVYKGKKSLRKKTAKCLVDVEKRDVHKKVRKLLSEPI